MCFICMYKILLIAEFSLLCMVEKKSSYFFQMKMHREISSWVFIENLYSKFWRILCIWHWEVSASLYLAWLEFLIHNPTNWLGNYGACYNSATKYPKIFFPFIENYLRSCPMTKFKKKLEGKKEKKKKQKTNLKGIFGNWIFRV